MTGHISLKFGVDIILLTGSYDHFTVFARWRQQRKNGRVTLAMLHISSLCIMLGKLYFNSFKNLSSLLITMLT